MTKVWRNGYQRSLAEIQKDRRRPMENCLKRTPQCLWIRSLCAFQGQWESWGRSASREQKGDLLILLDEGSNKKSFLTMTKKVVEVLGEVRSDPKNIILDIQESDFLISEKELEKSRQWEMIIAVAYFKTSENGSRNEVF